MTAKLGRPKSENSMTERITVRLGKEEVDILELYCKQECIDRAEAIRRGLRKLKSELKK